MNILSCSFAHVCQWSALAFGFSFTCAFIVLLCATLRFNEWSSSHVQSFVNAVIVYMYTVYCRKPVSQSVIHTDPISTKISIVRLTTTSTIKTHPISTHLISLTGSRCCP